MTALQLGISAAGLFVKSDSGLGAYLGALKQLSEVNIELSQNILIQTGKIQQQLSNMPNLIAEAFITNNEYIIRERLQIAIDAMKLVRITEQLSPENKARLEMIVNTCAELAAKRHLPYGKRGVAATCAPLAAALDIHARKLLGRSNEIPDALRTLYIDWLDQILDFKSKDSLAGIIIEQGKTLEATVSTQEKSTKAESESLSKLLRQSYTDGIGTKLDAIEVECLTVEDMKYINDCRTLLYAGDDNSYAQCLSVRKPLDGGHLLVSLHNTSTPITEAPKTLTRPAFIFKVTSETTKSCTNSNKRKPVEPKDLTALMETRKTAIEKVATTAIEAIDRERAALLALYQLHFDTKIAKRVLVNRFTLGEL
jgi:hypothetical protein